MGSPITIFTAGALKNKLQQDVIFAGSLAKNEEFVDYNGRPLNLLEFTTADVKVGKQILKQERIVITREGKKTLIGRDWLAKLNFKVAESNNNSEYNNNIEKTLTVNETKLKCHQN